MKQSHALVLLAAGIGSRFGGVKQLEPVGPGGEILMDYSVYDAVEAGFDHVVFIIRREIEADFHAIIGARLEAWCAERNVKITYVFQDMHKLPGGYPCPPGRAKPWGTVHALLACEGLDMPFVVLNADDYYGKQAFRDLLAWLKQLPAGSEGRYCMAGFRMENTLSDHGGVTRGICCTDKTGYLLGVKETKNIVKTPDGAMGQQEGIAVPVPLDCYSSMNIWGFTPDIFPRMEKSLARFLEAHGTELTSELVLPTMVDELLAAKTATVRVLPTNDQWLGVTYREDLHSVREAFLQLVRQGVYQKNLFGK